MNKYFRVLKKNISMNLSSYLSYRLSTLLVIIEVAISDLIEPLILIFIYLTTKGLPGWNIYELMLLNGSSILIFGISNLILSKMVSETEEMIENGTFDLIILKPLNIIIYMIIRGINCEWLPDIFTGIFLIIISTIYGGFNITLTGVFIFIYLIILFLCVIFGIDGIIIGITFKYFKANSLIRLLYIFNSTTKYPLSIYGKGLSFILTFILPLAISSYYPTSYLLGKITNFFTLFQLTITSLIFVFIGIGSIKLGLKYYSSAGG